MSSKHQDLWLWTFLGVFGFYAARGVHMQLRAMRFAAQITKIDRPQDNVNKVVENALKIETLWQLTRSPNQEIRAAWGAGRARIQNDEKRLSHASVSFARIVGPTLLQADLLKTLRELTPAAGKLPASLLETYRAIHTCLRNLNPEMHAFETAVREKFEKTGPGTSRRNGNRTKPCQDALNILAALLQHNPQDAVLGDFVGWVIEYPFGGYDSPEEKKKITADITSWYYEDPAMHTILSWATGRGLFDKGGNSFEVEEIESEWMWSGPVEGVVESATMRGGRRMREESIEEQALRRRRREAMVLGETGRPIERADIIERRNTGLEEEGIGQEQEAPMTEIHEDEDVREQNWWDWRPW
ncbi:hypothetical protein MMC22_002515 [Lobaria immixta]|nr:hypothetical protein [Lobaria immixta]